MFYLMAHHIPTYSFHIIDPMSIEEDVSKVFHTTDHGWVIRCGRKPDRNEKPEGKMPWNVCSFLQEIY